MAVDELVEEICELAETFIFKRTEDDVRGRVYLNEKVVFLNPHYEEEHVETFVHEMLHYYHHDVSCYDLGAFEETHVESEMETLLENKDNQDYVRDYLSDRFFED